MEGNHLNGTVVIESLKTKERHVYNEKRSKEYFLPASTFKIVNTLIALWEKVIHDETEIIKWDGKDKGRVEWNKDQNLKSAFAVSCVWFYQELAKRIGNDRYLIYLRKIRYGNMKTGSGVDSFWLNGDLRISAVGQISVLKDIYAKNGPFDGSAYEILKSIMIVDKTDDYIVRAKTGAASNVGWYVGYLETGDDVYFFSCNIDIADNEQLKYRKEIIYTAFKELGIIK